MQRPAPASAAPSAVQSCPRWRAVGACDEPTDRRGGQLVSDAQDRPKPPTSYPEEPIFLSSGEVVLGKTCVVEMCRTRAPWARAASTYSRAIKPRVEQNQKSFASQVSRDLERMTSVLA